VPWRTSLPGVPLIVAIVSSHASCMEMHMKAHGAAQRSWSIGDQAASD